MMVSELSGSSLLQSVWKKNRPKTRSKQEVKSANISEILQVLLSEGGCCPGALGEEVQQWCGSAACVSFSVPTFFLYFKVGWSGCLVGFLLGSEGADLASKNERLSSVLCQFLYPARGSGWLARSLAVLSGRRGKHECWETARWSNLRENFSFCFRSNGHMLENVSTCS